MDDLGMAGMQIFANVDGKNIDEPEFRAFFKKANDSDTPVWIHPQLWKEWSTEYVLDKIFGWIFDTSLAMSRLVFSGIMEECPNLKIITHHMGAMIPFFDGRVGPGWDQIGKRTVKYDYGALLEKLEKRPLDYFKMFYADTALFGSRSGTVCGLDFFGIDKTVFASDSPFDPEGGTMYIRETIKVIDSLDISEDDRQKIYHDNAVKLMKLNGN